MFWRGVERLGERWDVVGGAICGGIVLGGVGAVWGKGWWWGRWVEGNDGMGQGVEGGEEGEGEVDDEQGQGKGSERGREDRVGDCEEGIIAHRESSDAIRHV